MKASTIFSKDDYDRVKNICDMWEGKITIIDDIYSNRDEDIYGFKKLMIDNNKHKCIIVDKSRRELNGKIS